MQEGVIRMSPQGIPAIVFGVRDTIYALEQHGTAVLLPWLQRYSATSHVPGLPNWCKGLLNVRGTVQMVVDLGQLLGFIPCDLGEHCRLIFIEYGGATLGLLVDFEIGVRYLRAPDSPVSARSVPFSRGIAMLEERPVIVLDGAALIAHVAEDLDAPIAL